LRQAAEKELQNLNGQQTYIDIKFCPSNIHHWHGTDRAGNAVSKDAMSLLLVTIKGREKGRKYECRNLLGE
jgi:hypothetical protein